MWWAIELVLTVGGNISLATLGVEEFSVGELDQEGAVATAGNTLSLLKLLAYDVRMMGHAALMTYSVDSTPCQTSGVHDGDLED